ncbi:MAG: RNA-directed DNA polymerase [Cyanobacteria bacterium J06636_16]
MIARGYFPRELPPPFKANSLADFVIADRFLQTPSRTNSKLYSHSHIRYGPLRRKLSIPNPAFFVEMAKVIEDNWSEVKLVTRKSNFSKSKPTYTPHPKRNRSISPLLDFPDLPRERAKNRAIGRYVLQADISQFYQSIYTHSIPWAIHGKEIAKKRRHDSSLLGNQLDKLVRNSQDGQTMGIPIGPDTSLVIAELILCALDLELKTQISNSCTHPYRGFRYSDDYEFVFLTRSEAETALSHLQRILSDFELTLNPDKTKIVELPCSLDSNWVLELSDYKFNNSKLAQMQDIIRYFDRAFQISKDAPQEPVLKYAIARIQNFHELHQDNWPLLESLLLQSVIIESSTLRDALSIFQSNQIKKYPIDRISLEENLNLQVLQHAPLGHSSEVAWAVWSIIVFELSIYEEASQAISDMEDSIVAILALDAQQRGRIPKGLITKKWEQFLTEDELYGDQWLFSYEANRQGYLLAAYDHVARDSWFSQLKQGKVTFYERATPLIIPPGENSGPSGEVQAFGVVSSK